MDMVRSVNHLEEDEAPGSSSPTESKRGDGKGRSKHSETEQRRRSKINERFQILRDLIPANDQKRDKASFLLEVIEYVRFLQGKLQIYEGSCQGWSPEPTKLTPRRINPAPVESFDNQYHLERHLAGHEDNILLNPTWLNGMHNSVGSDLRGAALCKPTDNPTIATDEGLPLKMPQQPPVFDGLPVQHHEGSFPDSEQLAQQLRSHFGPARSCTNDCSVPIYNASSEELNRLNGEDSISSAYSEGLLNSLTSALQTSGVDLSQTNISVQLNIGKRSAEKTMSNMKDCVNHSGLNSLPPENISEDNEPPYKRFRAGQS